MSVKSLSMVALVLVLAGCSKPESTAQSPTPQDQTTQASAVNVHAEHTTAMDLMAASHPTAQPAHITAYMDVMNTMHTDMGVGMQAKNADLGFVRGMIPHHQGAIAMAQVELQYGKDPQMKALAQKIIDAQQGEIKFMQDWLSKNESSQPADPQADTITKAYQAKDAVNHNAMMQGMMEQDPDIAFAKGMIPHHQGAIDMTVVEKQYGKNAEILQLAKQINAAQTPEIKQMQAWLASQGAQ